MVGAVVVLTSPISVPPRLSSMPGAPFSWAAHLVTAYGAMPCGSPFSVRPSFCCCRIVVLPQPVFTFVTLLPIAWRKNV